MWPTVEVAHRGGGPQRRWSLYLEGKPLNFRWRDGSPLFLFSFDSRPPTLHVTPTTVISKSPERTPDQDTRPNVQFHGSESEWKLWFDWCCKSRELTMSRDILMAFITPLWKGSVNMRLALPCQTSLSCHSFHHYQRAFFRGRGERKLSLWLLPNRIWTEVIFSCLSLSLVVEPQRRTALKSWASRGINTHPILIWQRQPAQLWSWSSHVQKNFCWEEKQKHMWHAVVTGT